MDRRNKTWTMEEDLMLESLVGKYRIPVIAKRLGRTAGAIESRLRILDIDNTKEATGLLTVRQLAKTIKVDWHVVGRWLDKGLKAAKKATRYDKRFILIDLKDFWDWAEDNKELINFAKIEPNALPPEPDWVELERKKDYRDIPKRRAKRWTEKEDRQLIMLTQAGYSYDDIAVRLQRSKSAVEHRISRLGQQGKAELRKIQLPWTDEEVEMLLEMDRRGLPDTEIAFELGRETEHIRDKRRRLRAEGLYVGHKAHNRAAEL